MKQRSGSLIDEFFKKLPGHLRDFWLIWAVLLILLGAAVLAYFYQWEAARVFADLGLVILILVFLFYPMTAVYGLIGTSGSVRIFFISVIFLSLFFTGIYYLGFYRHAGVCYDVNQTHIKFDAWKDGDPEPEMIRDTVYLQGFSTEDGTAPFFVVEEEHRYQKITFGDVLWNTVLTSLIQEPTDLFAATAVFNKAMYAKDSKNEEEDHGKASLFHWVLIIQILISWIQLGVFISILYNKFRYES